MSRVPALPFAELEPDLQEIVRECEEILGFLPIDTLIMARNPALLRALRGLLRAAWGPGRIDMGLKRLMGEVTSKAAGCLYCTAHCAQGAAHHGVSQDKIDAVWEFETSALFSDAERAALQVALLAGHSPSQVEDAHFERLRRYYDDDQIIEIMSVISCFGFLNRWNDTLATRLEDTPLQYAKEHVTGWEPGKHRP